MQLEKHENFGRHKRGHDGELEKLEKSTENMTFFCEGSGSMHFEPCFFVISMKLRSKMNQQCHHSQLNLDWITESN